MKIEGIFAWYDFWIGFYWDKVRKCLYFFPFPMLGVKMSFAAPVNRPESGQIRTGARDLVCPPGAGCSWCDGGRAIAKQRKEGIPGVSPRSERPSPHF